MNSQVRTPRTSSETAVPTERPIGWLGPAGAGLAAGAVMGVLMAAVMPEVLSTAIPALYGTEGSLVGWVAHLAHSAVFGVLFAAIVRYGGLGRYADDIGSSTALGVAYGILVWVVAASVVMPLWLDAMGMAAAVPTFDVMSLGTHVVYGAVLGALFPAMRNY